MTFLQSASQGEHSFVHWRAFEGFMQQADAHLLPKHATELRPNLSVIGSAQSEVLVESAKRGLHSGEFDPRDLA